MTNPLDRPIWHALAGPQAGLGVGDGLARRFVPAVSPFVACAEDSPEALAAAAALCPAGDHLLFLQAGPVPIPPGMVRVGGGAGAQMIAERVEECDRPAGVVALDEADAGAMLALATLTEPGPFRAETHRFGQFWGVKDEAGRLLAMAGERLHLPGMREVSGVCTHPDARGQGHAEALSRWVMQVIAGRGEVPFLHAYTGNVGAIRLYERLGFKLVREVEAVAVRARQRGGAPSRE